MYCCPTCQKAGITELQKRWASRADPATCRFCGRLSYTLASQTSAIVWWGILLLVIGGMASAALGSYEPLLASACVAIAYNVWAWRRAELFPISAESAKAAATVETGLAVGVLAYFLSVFN